MGLEIFFLLVFVTAIDMMRIFFLMLFVCALTMTRAQSVNLHSKVGAGAVYFSFPTLDPANAGTGVTLSSGNDAYASVGNYSVRSTTAHTIASGGPVVMAEVKVGVGGNNLPACLISSTATNFNQAPWYIGWVYYYFGQLYLNNSLVQSGLSGYSTGDYVEIVLDCNAGTLKFYLNGTQVGTTITGMTGTWYIGSGSTGSGSSTGTWNFGATAFVHPISGAVHW